MTESNRWRALVPWIAAVLGGLLFFLGYVGFDQFYLEWISLVPVLWAIRDATPRRAFLIGWLAGTVAHTGGFYWIIQMFQQFAGAPMIVGVLGLLLLAAANGMVLALWGWGTRLVTRETGWSVIWVAPVLWVAIEKFWPEIFPNYLGASQYRLSLLTQIADLTGILGVSFLVVYINSTIYQAASSWWRERRFPWRPLSLLAIVLAAVIVYGEIRIAAVDREVASAQTMTIGLVQTNRGAAENYQDAQSRVLEHQEMSRELVARKAPDLIVWPEGVCSVNLSPGETRLPPVVTGNVGVPMLIGACLASPEGNGTLISNSALLTDPSGKILGSYDKSILVPFGEYIPFGDLFPALYSWSPYTSRFKVGTSEEPLKLGNHLLSVSICYEDIFPTHIRKLMQGGREHRIPELLLNLTNDSWYGNSTEPMEHLALASFRSIENRRALVRVTNTGVSAFVDPVGRIGRHTGVWTREVLEDRVPLLKGRTVYGVAGDWLPWLCAAISLGGVVLSYRRAASRRRESA